MNSCPVLPVTGTSTMSMLVAAAALTGFGVLLMVAVRWRRHPVVPVVVALAVGLAALAVAGHTQAAAPCPPTTTAPTATSASSPATSAPASTAASTTEATTTVPFLAADAVDDDFTVEVGATGSGNIFANDTLGSPPAALLGGAVVIDAGHAYPVGSPFRVWDGGYEVGVAVATVTLSSDGAIVFTGIAEGTGLFHYVFDQSSEFVDAASVFITVVLPPGSPTTPSTTTTSTSSTTIPPSTSTTTSTTTTSTTTTTTFAALSAPDAVE
jgi:hypothetical protein